MTKNGYEEGIDAPAAKRTAAATMPIHSGPLIARMARTKTKEIREDAVDVTWVPGTKDRSVERTGRPSPEPEKRSIIDTVASNLHPSYFAAVMATGIVSLAAHASGMEAIAWLLFRLNSVFYGVLCFLMLVRLTRHFPRLVEDFTNQSKSPGFLTLVPATCVLGVQFTALLQGSELGTRYGLFLWIAGTFLWVLVMYTFMSVMTIQHKKSSLESAITGPGYWRLSPHSLSRS